MAVVILAGGFGTRLLDEPASEPRPTVEIGERSVLRHVMKIYSHVGFDDFLNWQGHESLV